MTLNDLIEKLLQLKDRHQLGDYKVSVKSVGRMSPGCSVEVTGAYRGIDWDSEKILLSTTKELNDFPMSHISKWRDHYINTNSNIRYVISRCHKTAKWKNDTKICNDWREAELWILEQFVEEMKNE